MPEETFREMALGAALTVTLQEAFLPLAVLTVMMAVPAFFAVTTPEAETAATFLALVA